MTKTLRNLPKLYELEEYEPGKYRVGGYELTVNSYKARVFAPVTVQGTLQQIRVFGAQDIEEFEAWIRSKQRSR